MRRTSNLLAGPWLALFAFFAWMTIVACSDQTVSWSGLLAGRIKPQYPTYAVVTVSETQLIVHRPGLTDQPVDVDAVAKFCRRGPADCNYAIDQVLLALQASP